MESTTPWRSRAFSNTTVLDHGGLVVMNVLVAHDFDLLADRIALNMESANLPAVLFDWPGRCDRNTIVAGGAGESVPIASGRQPAWLKDAVRGIVPRAPRKRARNNGKP